MGQFQSNTDMDELFTCMLKQKSLYNYYFYSLLVFYSSIVCICILLFKISWEYIFNE